MSTPLLPPLSTAALPTPAPPAVAFLLQAFLSGQSARTRAAYQQDVESLRADLIAAGALSSATTQLVLHGGLTDGRQVRGEDVVRVQ